MENAKININKHKIEIFLGKKAVTLEGKRP